MRRDEEEAGPGASSRSKTQSAYPRSPLSRPARRPAHLVDVAIGPGPHALQQLEAVPWILQRHVLQQRHGPAPGRRERRSRRGAARGGAGRGGVVPPGRAPVAPRPRGRDRAPGRGQAGDAPPPGREEAPAGPTLGGKGKPRSRAERAAPRLFRQPLVPRALQVGSLKPAGPEGRRGDAPPQNSQIKHRQVFFFFFLQNVFIFLGTEK